jgi:hypothetical protein
MMQNKDGELRSTIAAVAVLFAVLFIMAALLGP